MLFYNYWQFNEKMFKYDSNDCNCERVIHLATHISVFPYDKSNLTIEMTISPIREYTPCKLFQPRAQEHEIVSHITKVQFYIIFDKVKNMFLLRVYLGISWLHERSHKLRERSQIAKVDVWRSARTIHVFCSCK